ncbi:MAG: OmpA family protein [Spirochaetales bacterium]
MPGLLTVLVDNKDYVPISKLKESESGELNLTTMLPDQDRATIELYLRGGRYLEHLHTFEVSNLHDKPERPRIVVSAHVRTTLNVTLRVDGELVETESFAVPEEVHDINWSPWLWAALVVILLSAVAIAGVIYLPDLMTLDQSRRDSAERLTSEGSLSTVPQETMRPPGEMDESESSTDSVEPDRDVGADPAERGPVGPVAAVAVLPTELIDQPLYFEPESTALLPETREQIDAVASAIARTSPAGIRVLVQGHTALFGTQAARIELSLRRAQNVADALSERLKRSGVTEVEIVPEGLGGARPITRDEADQWRNRRVVLSVEGR